MPPLVIAGAIAAGGALGGAAINSRAAGRASKTQEDAANRAQQFNERVYGEQRQAVQPYLDVGRQSLADLQARYGGQPLVNRFAPTGMTNAGQVSYAQPNQLKPIGSGMTLAAMQQAGAGGGGQAPASPPAAGAFGAPSLGQTVKLQAPDGEIRDVPSHLAASFMARGARRVM